MKHHVRQKNGATTLGITTFCVTTLSITIIWRHLAFSVVILLLVMLSMVFYWYAGCRNAECHCAEWRGAIKTASRNGSSSKRKKMELDIFTDFDFLNRVAHLSWQSKLQLAPKHLANLTFGVEFSFGDIVIRPTWLHLLKCSQLGIW